MSTEFPAGPEDHGELLIAEVTYPQTALVHSLQEVGQAAWHHQLVDVAETRTLEEVCYVYDPKDRDHLEAQAESIREKADKGGVYLALAHAEGDETTLLGYTAAFPNWANHPLKRIGKKYSAKIPIWKFLS